MQKKKIIIITIVLIILIIFLLVLFNFYLNNIKDNENLVQNIATNTDNSNILTNENSENQESLNINNENIEVGEDSMELNIRIEDNNFTATLYDNATTRSLLEKLPLTINMSELHGNEKYYYFDESLPTNSQSIRNIDTGDLMLYGSDCLVLFYKSFSTSYSYTRLGHIDNPEGLAEAVGSGNVTVTFEVAN